MVIRGRDPVLEMLRDLIMHRSVVPKHAGRNADTWRPLVPILVGPGGSGRTALLAELADQLHDQPHVMLDTAQMVSPGVWASIPDLLTTMVFTLVRQGGRRWSFSRYIVGRLVTEMDLDGVDTARARAQLCAELARVKDPEALGQRLASLVRLLPLVGGPAIPDEAVEQTIPLITRGLTQLRMGRVVTLRAGQNWYGHRDKRWKRDPVAELVALNWMQKRGNEDAQAEVVQVLMAAFLADVRSEAARWGRALGPVLLLDNADSGPAVEFLCALEAVRTAPGADLSSDHLTVIATSNGALLAHLGITDDEQPLDDERIDGLRAGRLDAPGPWLPVALRDLTPSEVGLMASDIQLPTASRHCVVRAVLGLTHGHPKASQLLLQAAAAAGSDRMNLQALLRARVPDRPGRTPVGERILSSMLGPLPEPLRGDLITCAAARTQEEAELLARSGLLTTAVRDRVAVLSRAYWSSHDDDGRPIMHPLLRRLLLRELAARDREGPRGWATVFGWLVANVPRTDDDSGRLHYALALGDVGCVAVTLADLLATRGGDAWVRLVRSLVTTAVPTFLTDGPVHTVRQVVADALAQQAEAVDRPDWVATVATLLTAWQAVSDPLVTVERADLHAMVATGLDTVAELACNGFAVLVAEADVHRQLTRLWQGCSGKEAA
jgi:hypothetical protein